MKPPRGQRTVKDPRAQERCPPQTRKVGESPSIEYDIDKDLRTVALDKVLKHHARHCTFWLFSGDRHCSCGRDQAVAELETLKTIAISGALKKV